MLVSPEAGRLAHFKNQLFEAFIVAPMFLALISPDSPGKKFLESKDTRGPSPPSENRSRSQTRSQVIGKPGNIVVTHGADS